MEVFKSPSTLFFDNPFFPIEHLKIKSSIISEFFIFKVYCHITKSMHKQNLIIYEYNELFNILLELEDKLSFKIIKADNCKY